MEGGDKERESETGEKGDEEHRREERPEEAPGGRRPPYVSPCLGELRKESGSKAGGGGHGEGEEWGEGGEVAGALGGEEQEEGVRRRLPITGDGSRVRESVATPAAGGGAGGEEEEEEDEEGEEALVPGGPGREGDRSNCPELVKERLRPGPASSLGPPPPVMAEVVAMTMTAFCGSATVL